MSRKPFVQAPITLWILGILGTLGGCSNTAALCEARLTPINPVISSDSPPQLQAEHR